ncbi:hypothetical protein SAY86_028346 [Trapa natans]|uniref:Uncharacterized protein n=1 Tax=Trapa natans TaxID=22666 RepID=A0AAN7LZK1_TRANT|nr:hypothetical protein SAY86_028346 [Trapa natans]
MKPSCIFLVLLLLVSLHSLSGSAYASAGSFKDSNSGAFPGSEVAKIKAGRKLIGVNGLHLNDYDQPGANPAHNPPSPSKKAGKGGNP